MKYDKEFRQVHPETIGETDSAFDMYNYICWLDSEYEKLKAKVENLPISDVIESKTFDIHNCINEIEKAMKEKTTGWMFISGSLRYQIKRAIDKMLYSR